MSTIANNNKNTMMKMTISSSNDMQNKRLSPSSSANPKPRPRMSTLSVLHNKLEYERQIQDQLLLEQQKEIESLQEFNDQLNHQISTLKQSAHQEILALKEEKEQLQKSTHTLKTTSDLKIADLEKHLADTKSTLTETLQFKDDFQSKYEHEQSLMHLKSEEISALTIKLLQMESALRDSHAQNAQQRQDTATLSHKYRQKLEHEKSYIFNKFQAKFESDLKTLLHKNRQALQHKYKKKTERCLQSYSVEVHEYNENLQKSKAEIESLKVLNIDLYQKNSILNEEILGLNLTLDEMSLDLKNESTTANTLESKMAAHISKYEKQSQEMFELQSKHFTMEEEHKNYVKMEKNYKKMKALFSELNGKYISMDFALNEKLAKIRRLSTDLNNKQILISKMKSENESLSQTLIHFKEKCIKIKSETITDGNAQKSETQYLKNVIQQILYQPSKLSCTYHKFCTHPLCNKPQFAWFQLSLQEIAQLKKEFQIKTNFNTFHGNSHGNSHSNGHVSHRHSRPRSAYMLSDDEDDHSDSELDIQLQPNALYYKYSDPTPTATAAKSCRKHTRNHNQHNHNRGQRSGSGSGSGTGTVSHNCYQNNSGSNSGSQHRLQLLRNLITDRRSMRL